jgi:hypothetical protein
LPPPIFGIDYFVHFLLSIESLFIWFRRARHPDPEYSGRDSSVLLLTKVFVHFLLAQKMNQKRAPEMTTSAFFSARYTSLIGATKKAEVRTISGLPSRRHFYCSLQIYNS